MRILLLETTKAGSVLAASLKKHGFAVTGVAEAAEITDYARYHDYDIILFDLDLVPGALDIIRAIRSHNVQSPICVLSKTSEVETRIRALNDGADTVIERPIRMDELSARLIATARRANGLPSATVEIGGLSLDLQARRVTANGTEVHLTNKEYSIVELLALKRGKTVTKDMMLTHMYDGLDEPNPKIIDVFICKIRKKLSQAGCPDYLQTVWGAGFAIRTPNNQKIAA